MEKKENTQKVLGYITIEENFKKEDLPNTAHLVDVYADITVPEGLKIYFVPKENTSQK